VSALRGIQQRRAHRHPNVLLLAEYLIDGYAAKVQGGERYVEREGLVSYDDGPWEVRYVWKTKQPAVVLTLGDEVVLFVTVSRENAEALLEAALNELESLA
jgi:hypothetical protein